MTKIVHRVAETDLASRKAAAQLRAVAEQQALKGDRVVIDLSAVLSLSESYADELFGVLVARHGLEWFSEKFAVRNVRPVVFHSIASAIRYRLETSFPEKRNIALLTARKALKDKKQASA